MCQLNRTLLIHVSDYVISFLMTYETGTLLNLITAGVSANFTDKDGDINGKGAVYQKREREMSVKF
ncbi:MAG TPA: hypothetical protein DDX85_00165 [Nitrospiraceae bacterium]|nr:hypothetical protein [Nitrospiraceae bacterium]